MALDGNVETSNKFIFRHQDKILFSEILSTISHWINWQELRLSQNQVIDFLASEYRTINLACLN